MPAVPRALTPVVMTNKFSTSSLRLKTPEVIAEREVPTTSYSGGEAHHSTLKIRDEEKAAETQPTEEIVVPLTREVYNLMTPSMKKMTLFGKVVIVTGYVF